MSTASNCMKESATRRLSLQGSSVLNCLYMFKASIMFLKKISSLAALGMALAWHPVSAQTSQRVPMLVHVEAHVPSEQFSVSPLGWDHTVPVKLAFDTQNRRLVAANRHLRVRSNIGDVSARLVGLAILTNGTASVPLHVSVGDKMLSMESQTVALHNDTRTGDGASLGFSITPGEHPPSGLALGNYSGVVSLLFETNPAAN